MHATAERRTDQNPERAGQETKLRRQHWANQRSRPGDCRKMVAENHPAICGHEVFAIVPNNRGRGALIIQHQHFGREPLAVKPITD